MLACTNGSLDIVRLLLANPTIDLHQKDSQGINAVYVSVYYGHLGVLRQLEDCGGRYEPNFKGTNVLHVASKKGYAAIVKYLLHDSRRQKMPLNSCKRNGMTSVMLAVERGHLEIVAMLKEAGADMRMTQIGDLYGGVDLLYIAAQNGHETIVSYLLEKQVIVDGNRYFDRAELTALQVATKHGHVQVVNELLRLMPGLVQDITKQRTKQKDNLLYLAIKSKSKKLVKLFAHYFVQDGQIDDENPVSGLTSFMLAALSNLQSIAIFLLGHCGANKDHRNRYQETSLHIAKRKKLSKAVQFLQKLGCRQDIENSDGITVNQIIAHEKRQ